MPAIIAKAREILSVDNACEYLISNSQFCQIHSAQQPRFLQFIIVKCDPFVCVCVFHIISFFPNSPPNHIRIMLMCKSYQLQQRHILAVMLFFATIVAMMERNVINMAITRMVHLPNADVKNQSTSEAVCMAPDWIAVNRTTVEHDQDHDQSVSIGKSVGLQPLPSVRTKKLIRAIFRGAAKKRQIQLEPRAARFHIVIVLYWIHHNAHSRWPARAELQCKICVWPGHYNLGHSFDAHSAGRTYG